MEDRIMKKLLAALALTTAACVAPAFAGDVGISIRIGEPGFYGQLDFGDGYDYRPRLVYSQPVVIERRYRNLAPIYVRVPRDHSRNWSRYCGRYNACGRPVYFVRDDWYRDVYSPHYRQRYANNWRDDRYDRHDRYDRRDDHRDWRNDRDHDRDHNRRDHDRRSYRN
jgi:hypothetical protein